MTNSNIVFIVGVPRSGTTLLSVLLNLHDDIYVPEKSHLGNILLSINKLKKSIDNNNFNISNELSKIFNKNERLKHLEIDTAEQNLSTCIEKALLKSCNKKIWIDKAPPYVHSIKEILHIFPQAKIIHIVRDPRSNVVSLNKRQYMNLRHSAMYWYKLNKQGLLDSSFLNNEQYYCLKYEDLLTNPNTKLEEITDFLRIEKIHNPQDKLVNSEAANKESSYVKNKIDASKVDSWKQLLTDKEISIIEMHTVSLLRFFGYPIINTFENNESTNVSGWKFFKGSFFTNLAKLTVANKMVVLGRFQEKVRIGLFSRIRKFLKSNFNLIFSEQFREIFK